MGFNETWRGEVLTKEDEQAILESDAENTRELDGNEELSKHLWTLSNIECGDEYLTW